MLDERVEEDMVKYEEEGWEYFFCDSCSKLSPVKESESGYLECMVCKLIIVPDRGGRKVIFTPDEAKVRGLPIVRRKEE